MARALIVDREGKFKRIISRYEVGNSQDETDFIAHAQVLIFNDRGELMVPKRSSTKKFMPGKEIPFSAGGHLDDLDMQKQGKKIVDYNLDVQDEGKNVINYRSGGAREANEELRPGKQRFSPEDFIPLLELSGRMDLSKQAGYPFKLYVALFHTRYDREKHGELNPNKSETEEINPRSIGYVRKHKLHERFGREYGEKLLEVISRLSRQIKIENRSRVSQKRKYGEAA